MAGASSRGKLDYGWDAPYVVRNMLIAMVACGVLALVIPREVHLGPVVFLLRPMLGWTAVIFGVQVVLFVHYWLRGKFRHRDFILSLHLWRGDERVLDVGCGRGLLLVGAAKRLTAGRATGLDVWNAEDLTGNLREATEDNLRLEGVAGRCELVTAGAEKMPFADGAFDVVVSNVCLHNLYDKPTRLQAVGEVARVLQPGGLALLSDYKLTGEYAEELGRLGWVVERRWGSWVDCFPPMRVVVARKPAP